ncbi:MAG: hypothetical protein A2Y15_01090 [Clostridiales bacterium GWF2_36_10]|nr:MAG: hypothetical protein A2Y15_01090 [Clostridiales bacterium GWF2_36_10]HAN20545.1 hypothetical protein [Clostridiales bacterium]
MDTAIPGKKTKVTKKDLFALALSFALSLSPLTAGVYPFGLSLLIASTKQRLYIMLGSLLSLFFNGGGFILPATILLFVFFVMRAFEKDKPCPLYLKLILAAGSSVLLAVKILVGGILLFSDVVMLVSTLVSIPVFTFLFTAYLDNLSEVFPKTLIDCSLVSFAFAATKFFGLITIADVPLSLAAGAVITLFASKSKGFLFGGVCGFVCGLACNIPAIAALGILGITYGLLESNSHVLACILSFMLSLSGYAYLSDFAPIYASSGMILAAILAFIPIRKKLPQTETITTPSMMPNSKDIKLKKFAAAFSALSGVFFTISDTAAAESITDTNQKIRKTMAMFCERCNGCALDQNEFCNHLTTEVRCKSVATYENLPLYIKNGCSNSERIIRAVNRVTLLKDEECEKGLKSLAEEYNSFSSLLNNVAKNQEDNTFEDKQLSKSLTQVLLENKITCDRLRVTGKRQKVVEVFGIKPDKMNISSNRLTAIMSETARIKLSTPEFIINDNYVIMRMQTLPKLHVEYAKTTLAKNGEPICGDTVSFFESEEKYFYCLLSDGMGSGRDAALTSRLSAIMLEKLLTIGADKKDALQMVNKMLTEKKEEIFATIDLLEVDRITSHATLYKVGAAPTFLIRNGECHRIEAKTPPAGIMREVIAEKISVTLRRGDFIVMVSDGVVQTDTELFDFAPLFKSSGCKNAHTLATRILEEARNYAECADDMSVCTMRFY